MLKHISFGKGEKTIALLIPAKDMDKRALEKHYVEPLEQLGIPKHKIIAFSLAQNAQGKAPVRDVLRPHLAVLEPVLNKLNIHNVLIADAAYFKTTCKVTKADVHYGYPVDTIWPGITGFVTTNYKALFYNPENKKKIDFSLTALAKYLQQSGGMFDTNILRDCTYPTGAEIIPAIQELHNHAILSCDIETYSLKVDQASIATIAFGTSDHAGCAFPVGREEHIRQALKEFFLTYQGELIYHGSTYDIKILIWELFMSHPRDYEGMLEGLHTMFRHVHDTKMLAYLSLNTTSGVSLKLKDLGFQYAGNYALDDIDDITKIPPAELLVYNMTDAVTTFHLYNEYYPVVRNTQQHVYEYVFLPALKVLTQMELCGVPINLARILSTEHALDDIAKKHFDAIMSDPIVLEFTKVLRQLKADKANEILKKLRKTADDFLHIDFNPGSHPQLAYLLYTHLDLPIIDRTDTGNPATGGKTLHTLVERIGNSRSMDKNIIPLLEHIIEWVEVTKILSTFIPAFKNNSISKDKWHYLHGCFNLGGAKSGRLSSSDPNLTNIPSTGTQYAKIIKECFQAPPFATPVDPTGWLFVGADYDSLEDKVSALLTKDPNKLDIYIKGYDGHCLRAHAYFGDKMPDIIPGDVQSINSIADRYPDLRQLSKSPTFLLTYMGTWKGLMKQFGFTKEVAQQIEANYHELYKVSDEWVMDRIREAGKTGYVELAFGLRLRTPILPQVILDSDTMPYQAHKEIKTAGNALGQSYGLLNTHSANMFMQRVWDSKYATSILPAIQIHDSQYYMIKNTLGTLKWVNDNLIECMEWNELDPIQHSDVKLGASLEVYYPDWANPIKIPNRVSRAEIQKILSAAITT